MGKEPRRTLTRRAKTLLTVDETVERVDVVARSLRRA